MIVIMMILVIIGQDHNRDHDGDHVCVLVINGPDHDRDHDSDHVHIREQKSRS